MTTSDCKFTETETAHYHNELYTFKWRRMGQNVPLEGVISDGT